LASVSISSIARNIKLVVPFLSFYTAYKTFFCPIKPGFIISKIQREHHIYCKKQAGFLKKQAGYFKNQAAFYKNQPGFKTENVVNFYSLPVLFLPLF
jgi:hypothetical protein